MSLPHLLFYHALMHILQVNILISDEDIAVIADFDQAVYANGYSGQYLSKRSGNVRWLPPENWDEELKKTVGSRGSPKLDVWSWAHVCMEVRLKSM